MFQMTVEYFDDSGELQTKEMEPQPSMRQCVLAYDGVTIFGTLVQVYIRPVNRWVE